MIGLLFGFLNKVIALVGLALVALISILPETPFSTAVSIDSQWLSVINWLFPVPSAILHASLFCTACLVYYGIRVAMKWCKLAGS